jgi:hypothetical protein
VSDPRLKVVRRGCYRYLQIPDAECRGRFPFAQAPAVYRWIDHLKGVPVGGAPGADGGDQRQPVVVELLL